MPRFYEARPDARQRLVKVSKGFQQRQAYRDGLNTLAEGKDLEIEPESDESLRKLKVNIRRAANEMNVNIGYGDLDDGRLLVWSESPRERGARRGRPRKSANNGD